MGLTQLSWEQSAQNHIEAIVIHFWRPYLVGSTQLSWEQSAQNHNIEAIVLHFLRPYLLGLTQLSWEQSAQNPIEATLIHFLRPYLVGLTQLSWEQSAQNHIEAIVIHFWRPYLVGLKHSCLENNPPRIIISRRSSYTFYVLTSWVQAHPKTQTEYSALTGMKGHRFSLTCLAFTPRKTPHTTHVS